MAVAGGGFWIRGRSLPGIGLMVRRKTFQAFRQTAAYMLGVTHSRYAPFRGSRVWLEEGSSGMLRRALKRCKTTEGQYPGGLFVSKGVSRAVCNCFLSALPCPACGPSGADWSWHVVFGEEIADRLVQKRFGGGFSLHGESLEQLVFGGWQVGRDLLFSDAGGGMETGAAGVLLGAQGLPGFFGVRSWDRRRPAGLAAWRILSARLGRLVIKSPPC